MQGEFSILILLHVHSCNMPGMVNDFSDRVLSRPRSRDPFTSMYLVFFPNEGYFFVRVNSKKKSLHTCKMQSTRTVPGCILGQMSTVRKRPFRQKLSPGLWTCRWGSSLTATRSLKIAWRRKTLFNLDRIILLAPLLKAPPPQFLTFSSINCAKLVR